MNQTARKNPHCPETYGDTPMLQYSRVATLDVEIPDVMAPQ